MKKNIRTYICTFFLILTIQLFGQSKDCSNVILIHNGSPFVTCFLSPAISYGDTIITYRPKKCSEIKFDSTANGHWKLFSNDSLSLLEIVGIQNGKKNGQNIIFYPNKQIQAKLNYINGKLFGETILYSETGKITEKGTYDANEIFRGTLRQFWDNGNLASEKICTNGFLLGKTKYWDKEGKVINEKQFEKLWYDCK